MPPDPSPASESTDDAPRTFDTTQWSIVVRAGHGSDTAQRAALGELCRRYWQPLHRFLCARGLPAHDANDIVQGFFANLIERGSIARADANRGRFRTFLIAALKNYHSNQHAGAGRQKRGGGIEFVSLATTPGLDPCDAAGTAPSRAAELEFDRQWAHTLIATVFERLRAEHVRTGRTAWFDALRDGLWGQHEGVNYSELAQRLDSTTGAVQVAVHRLRRRFGDYLREEVARTVEDPAQVEAELRHLCSVLSE